MPPRLPQLAQWAQAEQFMQERQLPEPVHAGDAEVTTMTNAMIHNRRM